MTQETTANSKIKAIKGIDYDLGTLTGMFNAALALDVLTDDQKAAHELMVKGGWSIDKIAGFMDCEKAVKAAIKDLEKPDHDALWYASAIKIGEAEYTVAMAISTVKAMAEALNRSSAAYNETHKDTGARIAPIVIEGGSSRKRATPTDANGDRRSYAKLGNGLLDKSITAIHFRDRSMSLRKGTTEANGTACEFKAKDGKWYNLGLINQEVKNLCAPKAPPSAWDSLKIKTKAGEQDGKDIYAEESIAVWYDANIAKA